MQQWEYLELFLDYYQGRWHDSSGRQGDLVTSETSSDFKHTGPLLNELGQQRWELVGIENYPYMSSGSSYGAYLAKWVLKRQRGG